MDPVPIGKLIEGEQHRDAIHIAIAPVTAARTLFPSQKIGFVGDGVVDETDANIGIVDPFLNHPVQKGDRFWMFLNPNTITSLRHVWVHPAFTETTAPETSAIPPFAQDKATSEEWMREFAAQHHYFPNYYTEGEKSQAYTSDYLLRAAQVFLINGERMIQLGSNSLRDSMYEDRVSEFWHHFEILTGIKPVFLDHGDNPFCCTC